MERPVIVIVGPTCSGKTTLAVSVAEKLNSEIISADSRQIFEYLDIGTAKPSDKELKKVKHYFVDILKPDEVYNVSRFESESIKIIEKISSENKIPVVAGGSGLYIKALIDGISDSADTDEELREDLLKKREELGNEYLYNELKKVDPESASKMLPQNWKRVIRGLEVYHLTGKKIWQHHKSFKREKDYNFIQFGLKWDRKKLYHNIEERVDKMIDAGLVEEVREILNNNYDKKLNSLNTVGYKEIISYLDNEISLERAVELIKRNTRRFAKRQMTWFNADDRIHWFEIENENDLNKVSEKIIEQVKSQKSKTKS